MRSSLDDDQNEWVPRVASFYSGSAEAYEELWAPQLLKLSRELVAHMPLDAAGRILEIASGVGTLLPEIQKKAPDAMVVATDLAHGMLRRAPEVFPRATSDAQRLPFADGTFDAAIMAFMLFHVPDPPRAVAETHRVVRHGAVIGTITWGEDPSYLALDVWNDELEARGAVTVPALARHELVDTEEKVTELLQASGFTDVRTWMGMHEEQLDLESFLRHRTGHGTSRHRFESLPEDARAEVIESVRERLRDKEPKAFFDSAEVIYATAIAD